MFDVLSAAMEQREARAREVLDAAEAALRRAEEGALEARQRWEFARIGREELVDEVAAESTRPAQLDGTGAVEDAAGAGQVPSGTPGAAPRAVREGHDERPPRWTADVRVSVLSGLYRRVFETVVAAEGLVGAAMVAERVGLGREKLAVERVRHRAYAWRRRAGWRGTRACPGRLRARPAAGTVIGPVAALAGQAASEGEQAGPPDHLFVVVGAALVVPVETASSDQLTQRALDHPSAGHHASSEVFDRQVASPSEREARP